MYLINKDSDMKILTMLLFSEGDSFGEGTGE